MSVVSLHSPAQSTRIIKLTHDQLVMLLARELRVDPRAIWNVLQKRATEVACAKCSLVIARGQQMAICDSEDDGPEPFIHCHHACVANASQEGTCIDKVSKTDQRTIATWFAEQYDIIASLPEGQRPSARAVAPKRSRQHRRSKSPRLRAFPYASKGTH